MYRIPVTRLQGVGPRLAERLARLDIRTLQDLLFHLPMRYEDRTRIASLGSLSGGDQAVVEGSVERTEVRPGRRRTLRVTIGDGTGHLQLCFFHFNAAQRSGFAQGCGVRCYGEVRETPKGLQMIHPEYRYTDSEVHGMMDKSLTPVYPSTEGVRQGTLRSLTDQALEYLAGKPGQAEQPLPEWLPDTVPGMREMPSLVDAVRYVHRPPPDAPQASLARGHHPAQQRLAFEELLAHHLSLRNLRNQARSRQAPVLAGRNVLARDFIESLPFTLTGAQQRVIAEIHDDLSKSQPMLRLVQGDVGSGKTVVAACAALLAVENGFQAALMAPTELLAEQHMACFRQWLEPLGMAPVWLSGRCKGAQRDESLKAIGSGAAGIVIGTHALFQDQVAFHHLGLVIIDEQHRFGVHQRLALRDKGNKPDQCPHQLIMTATPIPRTLAMAAYADLDTSVIDELPPGRKPVQTVALNQSRREEVMSRVRQACAGGSQVYWVCTLIEESDVLECQAAADTAALLASQMPELRIGLVHGRLKPGEKEQVMDAFKHGVLDLLVATTVIEVGVDVRNANLMIIENAERLGLSQLHQLRGRIGRGDQQGSCVLMYQGPLSAQARQRLDTLRRTTDGFEIARCDLDLRGPGDVLGTRQTGELRFRIADLLRDEHLLEAVEDVSRHLLERHPDAARPLIQRWLGNAERYADV